jgi:hypothetical protein
MAGEGGFPTRPTRDSFGPTYEQARPADDPSQELEADPLNLLCHQSAGIGLIAPRAIIVAEYTGGQWVYTYRAEAWNPKSAQAHPEITRDGAGDYHVDFASSYLDKDGNEVTTQLLGALCIPQAAGYYGEARASDANTIDFETKSRAADAGTDVKFLLLVW